MRFRGTCQDPLACEGGLGERTLTIARMTVTLGEHVLQSQQIDLARVIFRWFRNKRTGPTQSQRLS